MLYFISRWDFDKSTPWRIQTMISTSTWPIILPSRNSLSDVCIVNQCNIRFSLSLHWNIQQCCSAWRHIYLVRTFPIWLSTSTKLLLNARIFPIHKMTCWTFFFVVENWSEHSDDRRGTEQNKFIGSHINSIQKLRKILAHMSTLISTTFASLQVCQSCQNLISRFRINVFCLIIL